MNEAPRGRLVVVGGHSRRVGKTCLMEAILRATPCLAWHALKISGHRHQAQPSFPPPPIAGQTDRYLAAGAATAELLRLPDAALPQAIAPLQSLLRQGRHLLIESNRIVRFLRPDVVFFVLDPLNDDWKESSAICLERADALVFSRDAPSPPPLLLFHKILPAFRMAPGHSDSLGIGEWLRERLSAGEVPAYATPS